MALRVGTSFNISLVVEAELELRASRKLIGQTDEELGSPVIGRLIGRLYLDGLAAVLALACGRHGQERTTYALLGHVEALCAFAFHITIDNEINPIFDGSWLLYPNTEVVEVECVGLCDVVEVEGDALHVGGLTSDLEVV